MVCLPGLSVSVVFSGISALRCAELEYEKEQHKLRARSLQVSEYSAQARGVWDEVCDAFPLAHVSMAVGRTHFHLLANLLAAAQARADGRRPHGDGAERDPA